MSVTATAAEPAQESAVDRGDLLVSKNGDGCATVTMNRPSKRNAITLTMWHGLRSAFAEFGRDPEVRCILLKGAGNHFSAGGDISEFATVRANASLGAAYEEAEKGALLAILNCGKPTVAVIEGYAIGGACAVALACDFRIADRGATFFIPAGRLGIVYSAIECELLLRQVGLSNAKMILFSGERMNASEARRLNLIDEVVEGDLSAAGQRFAQRFADSAPISVAGHKFILNALASGDARSHGAEIEHWVHLSMESEDYAEGQRAFREKRAPAFKGV